MRSKRLRSMNVLITGGAGYIGSHLAILLAQKNYEVFLLDNFINSSPAALDGLRAIAGKNFKCTEGDVRDITLLKKILTEQQIEAVIHCAGLKSVAESVLKPILYYENNVAGTLCLLSAMTACNVKKLIFSSSATVYGSPQYLPLDEEHPIFPSNPYGNTKAAVEIILKDLAASDFEWKVMCLRYFNPVGAHDSGFIGELPNGIPNNLMPYITQVALGKLEALPVYGNDYKTLDGTGVRDYIHVMDLANAHLAALIHLENFFGWDAINIGTGQGCSVLQMIKAFEDAAAKDINFNIVSRRPGDIASCYANADKAFQKLGWKAQYSIDDMCKSTWKWMQNSRAIN
jgi:UDP-glucose 4-epimerase